MDIAKLQARSQVVRLIRRFFDEQGFLEVHTPRLVGLPGQEPYLEPFWTEVMSPSLKPTDDRRQTAGSKLPSTVYGLPSVPAALITSPEYMCKRIIAEGIEKIYDLGPCFRNNEPFDGTHDPEFLLLEWYRRDAELVDLMDDTEAMIRFVCSSLPSTVYRLPSLPFRRLTCEEAWKQYAGIDLAPLLDDREAMAKLCREHHQSVDDKDTWDDLYFKIFLSEIEPKLGWSVDPGSRNSELPTTDYRLPTFLYRYPKSMAALARLSKDDPRFADRVELYIGDLELANGFAELADETEQRARFLEEQQLRASLGKPTWPLDEKFLASLPKMGNAAGIAFGVDRLVMLVTGSKSINDVLPESARERFIR